MKKLHLIFILILGGLFLLVTSACTALVATEAASVVEVAETQSLSKKTGKYGITMIKLPAGDFMMGDSSCKQVQAMCEDPLDKGNKIPCADGSKEEKCTGNWLELPVHKVTLNSFWMAQTEVTQKQFHEVMRSKPSKFPSDKLGYLSGNNPVERVNWSEAKKFCEKIGYRLPTEAEWEYAARAGTTGDYYGTLDEIAWFHKNSSDETHPVVKKSPNSFGLYDMSGNAWEWMNDWYGEDYYKVSPGNNPQGPSSGIDRVIRGGSFRNDSKSLRASFRNYYNPDSRSSYLGFRCAQ